MEFTGREYMVRGRGYARSADDLETLSLAVSARACRSACAMWAA